MNQVRTFLKQGVAFIGVIVVLVLSSSLAGFGLLLLIAIVPAVIGAVWIKLRSRRSSGAAQPDVTETARRKKLAR